MDLSRRTPLSISSIAICPAEVETLAKTENKTHLAETGRPQLGISVSRGPGLVHDCEG